MEVYKLILGSFQREDLGFINTGRSSYKVCLESQCNSRQVHPMSEEQQEVTGPLTSEYNKRKGDLEMRLCLKNHDLSVDNRISVLSSW